MTKIVQIITLYIVMKILLLLGIQLQNISDTAT